MADEPKKHGSQDLDAMADEIMELSELVSGARSRRSTGPDDLSEAEYLTLRQLVANEPETIGDLQRAIGVVPAQMSRIIRSLENKSGDAYIRCAINPADRRRVDVSLTDVGREAYTSYRSARMETMRQVLQPLSVDDREVFMRILRQIRSFVAEQGASK